MPKFFDRKFEGKYVPRRVNEDFWFQHWQPILLWMVNTPYGRDLLCIDKNFPPIIEIRKNC